MKVAEQLLQNNQAYYCYATKEELDEMRERQLAAGLKPRYDGRWRDSKQTPPAGIKPVIRFKKPIGSHVALMIKSKGALLLPIVS